MTLDEAARSEADRAASKSNITGGGGVSALRVAIGHSDTLQRRRLRELIHQIDLDKAMRRRSIQQAILQAESWFWAMPAEQFHAAAPRPGDFNGAAPGTRPSPTRLRHQTLAPLTTGVEIRQGLSA